MKRQTARMSSRGTSSAGTDIIAPSGTCGSRLRPAMVQGGRRGREPRRFKQRDTGRLDDIRDPS
jgi:hypothetical protein